MLVALGDLSVRFPNMIEPYTDHIYARLSDHDPSVRKTTLMVLTHLILNSMVKIRGQVAAIARCLEDPVPRIRALAAQFFAEVSRRDPGQAKGGTTGAKAGKIYNILPDTLSRLSQMMRSTDVTPRFAGETEGEDSTEFCAETAVVGSVEPLSKPSFQRITRFLISFIRPGRQSDSLIEKLCKRFALWKGTDGITSITPTNSTASESMAISGEQEKESEGAAQGQRIAPASVAPSSTGSTASATAGGLTPMSPHALSFCLSQFTFTDRALRRIASPDLFKLYRPFLGDNEIYACFEVMLNKCRKACSEKSQGTTGGQGGGGGHHSRGTGGGGGVDGGLGGGGSASASGGRRVEGASLMVEEWSEMLTAAHEAMKEDLMAGKKAREAKARAASKAKNGKPNAKEDQETDSETMLAAAAKAAKRMARRVKKEKKEREEEEEGSDEEESEEDESEEGEEGSDEEESEEEEEEESEEEEEEESEEEETENKKRRTKRTKRSNRCKSETKTSTRGGKNTKKPLVTRNKRGKAKRRS